MADRERFDNDLFFGTPQAARGVPAIPERTFYDGRERPPPEISLATRTSATPMRFALVLFLVGWSGILFQASLLQQVVIGAPVFEELAKLGPALIVALLLRARTLWIRLPLAWLSGAAFGVMEHYVTYAEESTGLYATRVLFHALAPGVSMLVYTAIEDLPDVRARWVSTVPATLLHWLNNFSALVLGLGGFFLALPTDAVAVGISTLAIGGLAALTLVGVLWHDAFEARVRAILETVAPRFGVAPGRADEA